MKSLPEKNNIKNNQKEEKFFLDIKAHKQSKGGKAIIMLVAFGQTSFQLPISWANEAVKVAENLGLELTISK